MSNIVTTKVAGLAEIAARMRELPDKVDRHIGRHAVSMGGAIIRDEMKDRAPVWPGKVAAGHPEPGALKKAVFMKYDSHTSRRGRICYVIGCRHGKGREHVGRGGAHNLDAYYFFIVEFGRKNGKGQHAFMRPAFDAKKEAAASAIIEDLRVGIDRAFTQ
jgi:HK97 gp10 family phage protein